jgi:hypothetical protein
VLFKCEWVDVFSENRIKRTGTAMRFRDTFSHLIHNGDKFEDRPFIFITKLGKCFMWMKKHSLVGLCQHPDF